MNIDKCNLIPLLKDLSIEEKQSFLNLVQERKLKKGSHIIYAKDNATSIMFLLNGKARASLTGHDGKEIILTNFKAGAFFGEIALLTGEDRSADIVATEDCNILILTQEDFNTHSATHGGLSLSLLRELALRLRASSEKIGSLALLDVSSRVASTLNEIAESKTIEGKSVLFIEKRPTHQELASMVGTSREMITRALKALETEGYISLDGKSVVIHHLPAGF